MSVANHQEVLEKAIAKAIEGGWTEYGVLKEVRQPIILLDGTFLVTMEGDMHDDTYDNFIRQFNYEAIIYNKNFTKALWPITDKDQRHSFFRFDWITKRTSTTEGIYFKYDYLFHLAMMAAADDPIKYLGENI